MTYAVREATEEDLDGVVRLLDAAMLESDRERVRRRVDAGGALVAVVEGFGCTGGRTDADGSPTRDERVVGVCVLADGDDGGGDDNGDGDDRDADPATAEIEQIAVHRSRRGRGIGTALVDAAAAASDGPLAARFREQVRPFYESAGFEIRECEDPGSGPDEDGDPDRRDGGDANDDADRLRGVLR